MDATTKATKVAPARSRTPTPCNIDKTLTPTTTALVASVSPTISSLPTTTATTNLSPVPTGCLYQYIQRHEPKDCFACGLVGSSTVVVLKDVTPRPMRVITSHEPQPTPKQNVAAAGSLETQVMEQGQEEDEFITEQAASDMCRTRPTSSYSDETTDTDSDNTEPDETTLPRMPPHVRTKMTQRKHRRVRAQRRWG